MMTALFANALSMGLLSWGWFKLSTSIGIMTWVGFMGCTGYYASRNRFIKGWRKTVIANMSGTFIGCASTFGMNGDWKATIIGLLMGSVLGIASDYGGVLIEKLTHKKPIKQEGINEIAVEKSDSSKQVGSNRNFENVESS